VFCEGKVGTGMPASCVTLPDGAISGVLLTVNVFVGSVSLARRSGWF
jgi:hypothetical protein